MSDSFAPAQPQGELVIRTIAMPADTNSNGDMFGGWLVSQMDLGGAIYARNVSRSRITTVAIDAMTFIHPVFVGDIVSCHAGLLKVGRTSITVAVEAWARRNRLDDRVKVTDGHFVYVALGEDGQKVPVPQA